MRVDFRACTIFENVASGKVGYQLGPMLHIHNELAYEGLEGTIMCDPVCLVGSRDPCLGLPDFMTLLGNSFLYQLRGMVLAWALESIFTVNYLMPCIVKNVVCLSMAISVIKLPSLGRNIVILSK